MAPTTAFPMAIRGAPGLEILKPQERTMKDAMMFFTNETCSTAVPSPALTVNSHSPKVADSDLISLPDAEVSESSESESEGFGLALAVRSYVLKGARLEQARRVQRVNMKQVQEAESEDEDFEGFRLSVRKWAGAGARQVA